MEQVIKKKLREFALDDSVVEDVNPTVVNVQPIATVGNEIANIIVNGEKTTIYAGKGSDILVDDDTIKKTSDGTIYVDLITKSKVSDFGSYLTSTTFIPSKTSELVNDSGFALSTNVPTKVSLLENDSGYIPSSKLSVMSYSQYAQISAQHTSDGVFFFTYEQ